MRRNPKTGRCVRSKGLVGAKIRGRPKNCESKCNTKTRRCVKKNRKATRKKATREKLMCIPDKFKFLMKDCTCHKKWRKITTIGSGANGSCYRACNVENSKDCAYVVKVQPYNSQAKREFEVYSNLQGCKIIPKLYAAWLCDQKMYLVIEKLYHCKIRKKEVRALCQQFLKLGWLHVDTHEANIMCTKRNRHVLIDFGWAVYEEDEPYSRHPTKETTFEALRAIQNQNINDCF